MPEAPSPDWTRSPYTGWTRAHWVQVLARVTFGFARRVPAAGSPARVLYPDDRAGHPDAVDGLEAFSRLALAWGAWLRQPANPESLWFEGEAVNVAALLRRGLLDGTDPNGPLYWGPVGHMDQRMVEASGLAMALLLGRKRVWARLNGSEQAQVAAWLAQVDDRGTYPDNWVLFPAICQAVRLQLGLPAPEADLRRRLEQLAAFYRGDGWYVDGPGDEWDLYNAWMFGFHLLFWAWLDGDRHPDLRDQALRRARSFQAGFLHFFGANGVYVPWGRSLGSRFGAVGTFALGHLLGIAPSGPGRLRRASSGCLKYFAERGLFHPHEHFFTQGFHGPNRAALERYVSPASPNSALQGLLALTLDPDDAFWTATEEPLPVEQEDFELVLPTPGFVLSGRRATGQVLLLNSRGGHAGDEAASHYPPKYGKLAYSTHFPLNVTPAGESYAPDAMLALGREGQLGHRALSRQGGAAPGLTWAQFDQAVAGEPQPMWTALLPWGDAQVVVALIAPTRPVQAFYAPGALGAAGAAGVVRRSDPAAGWEYAEAEGRAVAVRRLLGFTRQHCSAPFAGQSNLNLAYPYAEQPLVLEAEPNVAARCLGAVGVLRPAPFEPAEALAGFAVAAGPAGQFALSFPDGEQAAVVLAAELPKLLAAGGARFSGPALRYARARPDGSAYAGAGVGGVEGVVVFEGAATFRLRRDRDGAARLLTDVGAALLDAPDSPSSTTDRAGDASATRHADDLSIEVLALNGDWVRVATPAPGCVPGALVREWQARNERTLIEFRIRP